MAYIGRGIDKLSNIEKLDVITFDGSSSYSLTKGSVAFTPSSANSLQVSIDGVVQAGNFTVSGSTIDFGTAVASTSTNDFIFHYGTGLITTPADGTVDAGSLSADVITGHTALTSAPADTDEFLISDAGTLKRIDFSLIKGGASDFFLAAKTSNQSISNNTNTKVTFTSEDFDTGSDFASSTYTAPSAGKYFFYTKLLSDCTSGETVKIFFYKNGSQFVEHRNTTHGSNRRTFSMSAILDLSASDTIEVYKFQDGGSSRDIDGDSNRSTFFMGYKLG
ncbi:hypothetical protein [uncultured Mediterranean phage uvMED]|nr:hypothetical protein [uncultured Mediterranean phage uvMED]